jgi:hypothetical protein
LIRYGQQRDLDKIRAAEGSRTSLSRFKGEGITCQRGEGITCQRGEGITCQRGEGITCQRGEGITCQRGEGNGRRGGWEVEGGRKTQVGRRYYLLRTHVPCPSEYSKQDCNVPPVQFTVTLTVTRPLPVQYTRITVVRAHFKRVR